MEFEDPLNVAEDDTFETHETRWLLNLLVVFNHLHVTLERVSIVQRIRVNEPLYLDDQGQILDVFLFGFDQFDDIMSRRARRVLRWEQRKRAHLLFSPYFVRSSTGSSLTANDACEASADSTGVSLSCDEVSSVCSGRLSDEMAVVDGSALLLAVVGIVDSGDEEWDDDVCGILDDGRELFVAEASLTDGVVTDKAAGIWKSLAVSPATILMGA
jgi:hypothetical protein